MAKQALGRVIDPEAIDASSGARGRLRIAVPGAWAREGAEIEITAPARVTCARCDGGGCDGCGRSGAHRTPRDPDARTLRLRLPARLGSDPVALRLVQPFGEEEAIEQLVIEVSDGAEASPGVTRVAPDDAATAGPWSRGRAAALAAALAVLAILAALAASR